MQPKSLNRKIILSLLGTLLFLNSIAQEKHLKNIQKLTFGGDNAEAYFSPNGQMLTMQISNPKAGIPCDQIYLYDLQSKIKASDNLKLISTGKGRTTCSYFIKSKLLFTKAVSSSPFKRF